MYTVILESVGNPDFGQNPNQPLYGCEPNTQFISDNLIDIRNRCIQFIMNNNLGSGNWSGGRVYRNGKPFAHVSYNGRIWSEEIDGRINYTKEIKLDGRVDYMIKTKQLSWEEK